MAFAISGGMWLVGRDLTCMQKAIPNPLFSTQCFVLNQKAANAIARIALYVGYVGR